jgi:hypothetical protein
LEASFLGEMGCHTLFQKGIKKEGLQALYAHMNNKTIKKKPHTHAHKNTQKKKKKKEGL